MQRLKFTLKGERVWVLIAWNEYSELKISKMQGLRKLEINQVLMKMGGGTTLLGMRIMLCHAKQSFRMKRHEAGLSKLAWTHF